MKRHNYTITGLLLGITTYILTIVFDLDLFEKSIEILESFERFEIDEFIIPLTIVIVFTVIHLVKKDKLNSVNKEKMKIYKAMISSSHHIINNFLNQIQLIKITAEDFPDFDPEVLKLYEKTVKDTKKQISQLSSISKIDETTIYDSVAPKADTENLDK